MIQLLQMPMSISINASLANNPREGARGRIKTKAYLDYIKAVEHWRLANLAAVNTARSEVRRQVGLGKVLHVSYLFVFDRGKIITQSGRPKRLDTSNRIKVLDDQLSALLLIDDSYFWSGHFTKMSKLFDDKEDYVDVTITFREKE